MKDLDSPQCGTGEKTRQSRHDAGLRTCRQAGFSQGKQKLPCGFVKTESQKGERNRFDASVLSFGYFFCMMGRPKRSCPGGWVYRVLNRANARVPIFTKDEDFAAFERVLEDAAARTGTRILSYCLMGNHLHLVVWPHEDGELSRLNALAISGCSRTAIDSLRVEGSRRRLENACASSAALGTRCVAATLRQRWQ